MKNLTLNKTVLLFLLITMTSSAIGQSAFNRLGEGEKSLNDFRKLSNVMIPQFRLGFETHSQVTIMRQEGKLSALAGNLATVGTDKTYNRQRSYVEASAILDAGMEKEDFQTLTNELHQILLDEFKKQGIHVVDGDELSKIKSYQKIQEGFSAKTSRQEDKKEKADLNDDRIYYLADNSLMIYKGDGVAHGVGTITRLKKLVKEADAVILLPNIDVDFCVIKLDAEVEGGWNYSGSSTFKSTNANCEVFPVMNISELTLSTIGSNGSVSIGATNITLKEPFMAEKSYQAKMYQDKEKSKSLFKKLFALGVPDVEFNPMIIELSKEDYMNAARDLFRQYGEALAKAVKYSQQNKK